jgi:hypothetical protein
MYRWRRAVLALWLAPVAGFAPLALKISGYAQGTTVLRQGAANRIRDCPCTQKRLHFPLSSLKLTAGGALDTYPDLKKHIAAPAGMNVYVTGGTAILYDIRRVLSLALW